MPSEVYLSRSEGHYEGVKRVLGLADKVLRKAGTARQVVVKVNFVSAYRELCATPVGAVRAVIEALSKHYGGTIIVAERPAQGSLIEALRNYGYLALKELYDVEFVDIGRDDYEVFEVWDSNLDKTVKIRVSKTMLDADYLVSVVRPKTHDTVVVTLTIKNVVVGAVHPGYRGLLHQGYKAINLSIAYLARHLMPSLAVVDGYVGMEGDGPIGGSPKKLGVAVVGEDPVAVDSLVALLMGFNPKNIGYLYYLSQWGLGFMAPNRVRVVGVEDWKSMVSRFKPHRTYFDQLGWRLRAEEEVKVLRSLRFLSF